MSEPTRLRPVAERNDRRREFVETIGYVHEDGTAYAPAELPEVNEDLTLFTGRYHAHRAEHGVAVATSLGKPDWPLPYPLEHEVRDLMPFGLFGAGLSWPEFEAGYRARLDGVGVERLRAQFEAIAAQHPGQALVLLCWEKPGEPCHRRVFAEFWEERTGQAVPEVGAPTQLRMEVDG